MSALLRRLMVVSLIASLVALAAFGLSGCCPWLPSGGRNGTVIDEPDRDLDQDEGTNEGSGDERSGGFTDDAVLVPDVLGEYYDDAAARLEAEGLEAVEVSVHGPIDEDAGEIGLIYRQTPGAGSAVEPGSKVELRYWWESQ